MTQFSEYLPIVACVLLLTMIGILYTHKEQIIQKIDSVLGNTEKAAEMATPLLEYTPLAPAVNVFDEVLKVAETATHYAEQLYSNDATVDRKAIATEYVVNALKAAKIDIDPRTAHIIDGAIEAAVLWLPEQKASTLGDPPKAQTATAQG